MPETDLLDRGWQPRQDIISLLRCADARDTSLVGGERTLTASHIFSVTFASATDGSTVSSKYAPLRV